jgi:septal ring factor EnvC (AmiA/AmiB activator)
MAQNQSNATQIKWRIGSLFLVLSLSTVIFYPDREMIRKILNLKTKEKAEDPSLTDFYAKQELEELQKQIENLEQELTATQNELQLSWREKDELLAKFIEQDMKKKQLVPDFKEQIGAQK